MADKNLSTDITEATTIADADDIYIVTAGGNSRRVTWGNLKDEMAAQLMANFAPVRPNWDADYYLTTPLPGKTGSWGASVELANYMYFYPVVVPADRTFTTLVAKVTTGQASSNIGMAVYDSDGSDGEPGTLLANSGDVSCASAAAITATISLALTAGQLIWLCLWNDSDTTKVLAGEVPAISYQGARITTGASGGLNNGLMYRLVTFDTSSWPDPAAPTGPYSPVNGNSPPLIGIR